MDKNQKLLLKALKKEVKVIKKYKKEESTIKRIVNKNKCLGYARDNREMSTKNPHLQKGTHTFLEKIAKTWEKMAQEWDPNR